MSTDATTPNPAFPDHPNWAPYQRVAGIAAIAGLAVWAVVGGINLAAAGSDGAGAAKGQFFLSLLVGYIFWFSLPFGSMSLLFFHYLAKTSWGLLLKRMLEASTKTLPLFFVIFLILGGGLMLGKDAAYWWVDPNQTVITPDMNEAAAKVDAYESNAAKGGLEGKPTAMDYFLKQKKKDVEAEMKDRREGTFGFLSMPMYFGVGFVVFVIWYVLILVLDKWSQESQNDQSKTLASLEKLSNLSGPGVIIWAITGTAIASQWVMSLEPSWASTMFPVIFGINSWLTTFAFCLALFLTFAAKDPLKSILREKFQIDMGTLLLVFTLLWTYTSFSQMMLIWIGNLPEEIPFYLKRSNPTYGFWWFVSAGLILLHFFLPFLLLLFRDIKLNPKRLRAVAIYLLVICAIDVTWWIEPSRDHSGFLYLAMDAGAIVGIGGAFAIWFFAILKKRPLLPVNETFMLPEGHSHHEQH